MTDSPDLLSEAREICATVAESRGPVEARCAVHYRDGLYDGDREMEMTLAALRRGMALERANWRAAEREAEPYL